MALVYQAEIRPSKIELITEWAPTQPWFKGDADAGFMNTAAYRFDDPEGEVGIETLLVRVGGGPLLQVPLTYRGAPLEGADAWLITTMEHSVLGNRWVYDGTGDPAYLAAIATAALAGGQQAEVVADTDGELTRREPTAVVAGSGTECVAVAPPAIDTVSTRYERGMTVVDAGDLTISVVRVLDPQSAHAQSVEAVAGLAGLEALAGFETLAGESGAETVAAGARGARKRAVVRGTWTGQSEPLILVAVAAG